MYDDIGGPLRIKELRREKEELFRSLELFYKVFSWGGCGSMKPLKIGNVNIDRPLALAPMAGVTDQPFPAPVAKSRGRAGLHGNGQRQGYFI